jgi:hypothetical protein
MSFPILGVGLYWSCEMSIAEPETEYYPEVNGYRLTHHENPLSYYWCEADKDGEEKIVSSGIDRQEAASRVRTIIAKRIAMGS